MSVENCKRCFCVFQIHSDSAHFCKTCLGELFSIHSKVYPWLAQTVNWPVVEKRFYAKLDDSLERLKVLIATYNRYGRQMIKFLPDLHPGKCYLCPNPLPWREYPEPVCLNCIEHLNELRDPNAPARKGETEIDAAEDESSLARHFTFKKKPKPDEAETSTGRSLKDKMLARHQAANSAQSVINAPTGPPTGVTPDTPPAEEKPEAASLAERYGFVRKKAD